MILSLFSVWSWFRCFGQMGRFRAGELPGPSVPVGHVRQGGVQLLRQVVRSGGPRLLGPLHQTGETRRQVTTGQEVRNDTVHELNRPVEPPPTSRTFSNQQNLHQPEEPPPAVEPPPLACRTFPNQ